MRQTMYLKTRDILRKGKNAKNGQCKKFLESGGIRMNDIARICLNMDGQKNKSDSTTHLPGKTILTKLHLEKGDDGRRTGTLLLIKKENKVRWGNALIFVKRSKRVVNCTKNTLKVPAKETVQSIQQIKQDKSHRQRFEDFEEYNYMVHLELDGNIIYISASSSLSAHWEQHEDWKSHQSWDCWRSSTWIEQ